MGETLPIFSTTFNGSVQVEARADHLSADTGALVLREIMERTGIVDWMDERLLDPRNPLLITYRWPTCCGPACCCSARAGATRTTRTGCGTTRACGWPTTRAAARPRWSPTACCPRSRHCRGGGPVERADQPGGRA